MKHVIAGRLGAGDNIDIPTEPGETLTNFDFTSDSGALGHGIGRAIEDLCSLGISPTETGVDIQLLAALVYAADTRINRRSESQDNWTREIRLVMPVLELESWSGCADTLKKLLDFLTGDRWTLEFRHRPEGYHTTLPLPGGGLFKAAYSGVSLFSGGMDSLIGGIDELSKGNSPLFVSHAGDGATSKAQENCMDGLRPEFKGSELAHFRIWLQIKSGLVNGVKGENTTRSRSFLFIAAAMMAGSGLGHSFRLSIPENGLIALNVPLDPNRVGALSTRTTHPFYFARWKEVADRLGIQAEIVNPYWNRTKGEMAEQCANRRLLRDLLPLSMSCSSPTKGRWQGHGTRHCGYCLPCIIRRAAVRRGFGDSFQDPTPYTLESMEGEVSTRRSIGKQARSFQLAIQRLRDNPRIAEYLILKTGPLSDVPGQRKELADVYRRGMLEVGEVLDDVITIAS